MRLPKNSKQKTHNFRGCRSDVRRRPGWDRRRCRTGPLSPPDPRRALTQIAESWRSKLFSVPPGCQGGHARLIDDHHRLWAMMAACARPRIDRGHADFVVWGRVAAPSWPVCPPILATGLAVASQCTIRHRSLTPHVTGDGCRWWAAQPRTALFTKTPGKRQMVTVFPLGIN